MQRVSGGGSTLPLSPVPSPAATRSRKRIRDSSGDGSAASVSPAPLAAAPVAAAPVTWVGERIGSCHYAAAQFAGRVYHVSDTVLLQSGSSTPYVCRIERMMERENFRKVMYVRWCFRPHDVNDCAAMLRRQPYAQEVFLTDVVEENDLGTILGRCYVLPPHKYARLPSHLYDTNVFCCSLYLDSARETFRSLRSVNVGPFYSEPPLRAPRINMPLIPLSGAIIPGLHRAQKKKRRSGASGNAPLSGAPVMECSVEDCKNLCYSKVRVSQLQCDWSFKEHPRYVCEEHAERDSYLSRKRSRSLTASPIQSDDEGDEETFSRNGSHSDVAAVAAATPRRQRQRRAKSMERVLKRSGDALVPTQVARGVLVYLREGEEQTLLGEIIILPQTSIAQVRAMIRDELGVTSPYILKKCNIPLPRNIDWRKASLFFSCDDESLIVERK